EDLAAGGTGEEEEPVVGADPAAAHVVLHAQAFDVDGVQDHVGAAEHPRHVVDELDAAAVAEAGVGVDVPDLAGQRAGQVALLAAALAHVAAADVLRIEAVGEEDDLLAAGDGAQRRGQAAQAFDLPLDAAADELLVG